MNKIVKSFDFEIKQDGMDEGDGVFTFEGFASTFGNVDRDGDIIVAGAFTDTIREMTPKMLWQHDQREVIGKFINVEERPEGLFVRGTMPLDDDFVRGRVVPQMKHGSLNQMSIGFSIVDSERDKDGTRKISKVKLWEVSLVTIPANPLANVTAQKCASLDMETKSDSAEYVAEDGSVVFDSVIIKAAKLIGLMGGDDLDGDDRVSAMSEIKEYYKQAERVSPFSDDRGFIDSHMVEKLTITDLEKSLRIGCRFSRDAAKFALSLREAGVKEGHPREAGAENESILNNIKQMTAKLKGEN